MRSDDTGAWFERRLHEPSFVIPEIADFRRQRADASAAVGRADLEAVDRVGENHARAVRRRARKERE